MKGHVPEFGRGRTDRLPCDPARWGRLIAGMAWAIPPSDRRASTMSETPHDPDAGLVPAFAAPARACDAHFHVFGPAERYAYDASDLRYRPPLAPLEDYLATARRLGFERFVFVQPSAYGMDNSCMLDAMGADGSGGLPRHRASRRDQGEGRRARALARPGHPRHPRQRLAGAQARGGAQPMRCARASRPTQQLRASSAGTSTCCCPAG